MVQRYSRGDSGANDEDLANNFSTSCPLDEHSDFALTRCRKKQAPINLHISATHTLTKRISAKVGQILVKVGRVWPASGHIWPISVEFGRSRPRHASEVAPGSIFRAIFEQCWSIGSEATKAGSNFARCRRHVFRPSQKGFSSHMTSMHQRASLHLPITTPPLDARQAGATNAAPPMHMSLPTRSALPESI